MQSTSPQRAKDVFLRTGLSLGKAGLKRLPSHDYLPSFGDWGCWLAWQRDEPVTSMRARLATSATLHDELRYLTKDKLATVFAFGKRQLEPRHGLIANTKLRPVLIRYDHRGFVRSQ